MVRRCVDRGRSWQVRAFYDGRGVDSVTFHVEHSAVLGRAVSYQGGSSTVSRARTARRAGYCRFHRGVASGRRGADLGPVYERPVSGDSCSQRMRVGPARTAGAIRPRVESECRSHPNPLPAHHFNRLVERRTVVGHGGGRSRPNPKGHDRRPARPSQGPRHRHRRRVSESTTVPRGTPVGTQSTFARAINAPFNCKPQRNKILGYRTGPINQMGVSI